MEPWRPGGPCSSSAGGWLPPMPTRTKEQPPCWSQPLLVDAPTSAPERSSTSTASTGSQPAQPPEPNDGSGTAQKGRWPLLAAWCSGSRPVRGGDVRVGAGAQQRPPGDGRGSLGPAAASSSRYIAHSCCRMRRRRSRRRASTAAPPQPHSSCVTSCSSPPCTASSHSSRAARPARRRDTRAKGELSTRCLVPPSPPVGAAAAELPPLPRPTAALGAAARAPPFVPPQSITSGSDCQ
ncbi:hypothetical protein PLESTB_001361700 [Pleodorina starrii]|uniref:Uncharacterized protein n=1 Tax=Pleodorina starrii TaxID=330485 RepID=A0A9W6BUK7_9CHLO|nr:hypothetical protein PLESTB_001361700 [Pleodorina starrii]